MDSVHWTIFVINFPFGGGHQNLGRHFSSHPYKCKPCEKHICAHVSLYYSFHKIERAY